MRGRSVDGKGANIRAVLARLRGGRRTSLPVSLLAGALLATLGAGLALDHVFARFDNSDTTPLAAWRALGRQHANAILGARDPADALEQATRDGAVTGSVLVPRRALAPGATLDGPGPLDTSLGGPLGLALESDDGVTVYYAVDGNDRLLALSYPRGYDNRNVLRWLLTLAFYLALLSLLLAWLLPVLRRLTRLSRAARAFGEGELAARVSAPRPDELGDVESTFNTMAARIESLVEDNRLLSRGVSHDLRTPLARVRFGIDALREQWQEGDLYHAQRETSLNRLDTDIATMERLVAVMLDYARLDARLERLPSTPVDLTALVAEGVAALGLVDVSIEFVTPDAPSLVDGHAGPLSMLIDNLLANAVRHAQRRVRVTLARHGDDGLRLAVEDDGPGISIGDRTRVLKPFERGGSGPNGAGDTSRSSADHGHGLGLATVDRIAGWHGATLHIATSDELGGACVGVTFPAPGLIPG